MLGWALLRAFVLPARAHAALQARAVRALVGALGRHRARVRVALWIALFYHAEQLNEWLSAAQSRSGGEGADAARRSLDARKNWIDFSFTPLAIALGKIAAPMCLLRLVW